MINQSLKPKAMICQERKNKMTIDAKLVKDLREKTGEGMMDCKKALVESEGDINKAIDNLRKSGIAKAEKKRCA